LPFQPQEEEDFQFNSSSIQVPRVESNSGLGLSPSPDFGPTPCSWLPPSLDDQEEESALGLRPFFWL
jgi:hypothetical protein